MCVRVYVCVRVLQLVVKPKDNVRETCKRERTCVSFARVVLGTRCMIVELLWVGLLAWARVLSNLLSVNVEWRTVTSDGFGVICGCVWWQTGFSTLLFSH